MIIFFPFSNSLQIPPNFIFSPSLSLEKKANKQKLKNSEYDKIQKQKQNLSPEQAPGGGVGQNGLHGVLSSVFYWFIHLGVQNTVFVAWTEIPQTANDVMYLEDQEIIIVL